MFVKSFAIIFMFSSIKMGDFDPAAWELFLRKMIAYNFKVFGISQSREGESMENGESGLNKLCKWNMTQSGLHSMIQFQNKIKTLAQDGKSKFQFEHEMK